MPRDPLDAFVEIYVQALQDQNAAIFAGAGLSIPAGLVNWKELLEDIAAEVGLDVHKEDDLVTVAQFHVNEHKGRHRINQALIDEFSKRAKLTENHKLLATLPVKTYWTTNYDTLLEDSIVAAGKRPDVKRTVENLALTVPRRDAVVYKMRGDISLPDKAVVTRMTTNPMNLPAIFFPLRCRGILFPRHFCSSDSASMIPISHTS